MNKIEEDRAPKKAVTNIEAQNNLYETFIAKSRYARYIDASARRENWAETTARYMNFMAGHLQAKHNYTIPPELYVELQSAIENCEVMPSMRALMTSGKALSRDNTAGYNCFAQETKFITDEGIKSFSECYDGQQVNVLATTFKPAIVKKFGKEKLLKMTVSRAGKYKEEIFTTANHRWIVIDAGGCNRRDVETSQLSAGMILKKTESTSLHKNVIPCNIGIMHGIVFGDGSKYYTRDSETRKTSTHIILCGDSVDLSKHFTSGKKDEMCGEGAQARQRISFLPWNWKELPPLTANKEYLLGFLMGWFAADGSIGADGSNPSLSNKSAEMLEWARSACAVLGIMTRNVRGGERVNPFDPAETTTMYSVSINQWTLPESFFLKEKHRLSFEKRSEHDKFFWIVDKIEETDRYEDVWCVQVQGHEYFTLANGIETRNCSYLPIDDMKAFDEAMYILLCGTGVGFSVERQYTNKLPEIPEKIYDSESMIVVSDSKEGWAKALRQVIAMLYSGEAPRWDVSKVRAAGARLKVFGGRASGPEPLVSLFNFVVRTFKQAAGRKLNSLECHDIMCKIGEVVVVGGVRRSAMISLSNLSDDRMRHAKSGAWWETQGQRALANNSACYTERPDVGTFLREWLSLYDSKSGERGIFNREAAQNVVKMNGRRNPDFDFGTNPCSEIILRPYQFCNLTEVIVRSTDKIADLKRKMRIASILGTFQSTLTHFPYLRKVWRDNTEAERLLGVSMTGMFDNAMFVNPDDPKLPGRLEELRNHVVEVNKALAEELGIPQSAATTAIKPSGTVSQRVDSSSGMHARHAEYYYRRVRADNKDPLTQFMIASGVPNEPDVTKPGSTTIFTFPKKAPQGALLRKDLTAIQHLKLWLVFQKHYCEHKPSVTISVTEKEWPAVGAFVWEHFDSMSGVSFLPYDGGNYRQAPYEDCTEQQYNELMARMPTGIDWDSIIEIEDNVEGAQMLACTAGGCEI